MALYYSSFFAPRLSAEALVKQKRLDGKNWPKEKRATLFAIERHSRKIARALFELGLVTRVSEVGPLREELDYLVRNLVLLEPKTNPAQYQQQITTLHNALIAQLNTNRYSVKPLTTFYFLCDLLIVAGSALMVAANLALIITNPVGLGALIGVVGFALASIYFSSAAYVNLRYLCNAQLKDIKNGFEFLTALPEGATDFNEEADIEAQDTLSFF